jgi:hypothetical protein
MVGRNSSRRSKGGQSCMYGNGPTAAEGAKKRVRCRCAPENAHRSIPVHSARHHASLSLILRSAKPCTFCKSGSARSFYLGGKLVSPYSSTNVRLRVRVRASRDAPLALRGPLPWRRSRLVQKYFSSAARAGVWGRGCGYLDPQKPFTSYACLVCASGDHRDPHYTIVRTAYRNPIPVASP